MHKLKGDTLIEVALAIGIFSLVAITVVSVVSASLTSAQSSLEITLAREELDSQAEAIRFIHDSYVSGSQSKDVSQNSYKKLWDAVVAHAIKSTDTANKNKFIPYNPAACTNLYTTNNTGLEANQAGPNPFVINIRKLSSTNVDDVIINGVNNSKFKAPATYPRILYTTNTNASLEEEANYNNDIIQLIEGIYIIAVQGADNAIVVDPNNPSDTTENKTSYYDFYIRSCWMPLNSDRASTISTVVRLYDPAAIEY